MHAVVSPPPERQRHGRSVVCLVFARQHCQPRSLLFVNSYGLVVRVACSCASGDTHTRFLFNANLGLGIVSPSQLLRDTSDKQVHSILQQTGCSGRRWFFGISDWSS